MSKSSQLAVRSLRAWLTCLVLGLVAAPAGASALAAERARIEVAAAAEPAPVRADSAAEAQAQPAAIRSFSRSDFALPSVRAAAPRPVCVTDAFVLFPELYVRHCALLR